jgi:uncharacterized protein YndB with AHSA1/START domain
MPTSRRSRVLAADAGAVWAVVSDPSRRPAWWPNVARVEEIGEGGWTDVMQTERGRPVRADFTLLAAERPHLMAWRQELEESPFERLMASAETEVQLTEREGGTLVRLVARRRMRGWALFGGLLVRRATRRQLRQALDALEAELRRA